MKRILLTIVAAIVIAGVGYAAYDAMYETVAPNPDPNHTHADFAIWIDGEKMDFSGEQFMSEAYDPEMDQQIRVDPMRKYLHLHDGNGDVLHRHKPGLTFGEFLRSLGIEFSNEGLNLCMQIPGQDIACEDEAMHRSWVMIVNGVRQPFFDTEYLFNDLDKILVALPQEGKDIDDLAIQNYWNKLTDDSCLYSQTCPERGEPPTENCIADPEVPCVIPE